MRQMKINGDNKEEEEVGIDELGNKDAKEQVSQKGKTV